jgi:hypothetical protein
MISVLPLNVASVVKPSSQMNLASTWKRPEVVVEEALVMEGTAPHDLREHVPVQAPLANESAPSQPVRHWQLGALSALAGHATLSHESEPTEDQVPDEHCSQLDASLDDISPAAHCEHDPPALDTEPVAQSTQAVRSVLACSPAAHVEQRSASLAEMNPAPRTAHDWHADKSALGSVPLAQMEH